jgi:large subunit ribosomal protein L11
MNFCKEYNTRTKDKDDLIIPVETSAYEDRSFSFILKTSPASILLKKVVNINKGSSKPNKITVGHVINFQLEEIANIKIQDLNTKNIVAAKKKLLRVLLEI